MRKGMGKTGSRLPQTTQILYKQETASNTKLDQKNISDSQFCWRLTAMVVLQTHKVWYFCHCDIWWPGSRKTIICMQHNMTKPKDWYRLHIYASMLQTLSSVALSRDKLVWSCEILGECKGYRNIRGQLQINTQNGQLVSIVFKQYRGD